MGIKRFHTHEGKECFVTRTHYPLADSGLISVYGSPTFEAKRYAVGYMTYTGQWVVYDIETGKDIAHLSREFYETAIKPMRIGDLVVDPDCKETTRA